MTPQDPIYSLPTTTGQAKLAYALATNQAVQITHMVIGDGNGVAVQPSAGSALAREVYRAPLNQLYQHPDNSNWLVAELVIPAEVGGWTIRELGLIDVGGNLLFIGNHAEQYKPVQSQGSDETKTIRMVILVSDVAAVTLKTDPSVVLATRKYCDDKDAAHAAAADPHPQYATAPEVAAIIAAKTQTTPGDTTPGALLAQGAHGLGGAAINLGGDSAADPVTLAEIAALPNGLYRVGGYWTDGPLVSPGNAGSLWWNKSPALGYGALIWVGFGDGRAFVRAYNDGAWGAWVELASTAFVQAAIGAGNVSAFAMSTAPAGWLKANGAAVSRATYAALFAAIGTTFGAGNGSTTFNLPDLRGEFLRGWDDGRGVDSGRVLGAFQDHAVGFHNHTLPTGSSALDPASGVWGVKDESWEETAGPGMNPTPAPSEIAITGSSGYQSYAGAIAGNYAAETRPRNIPLLYCIKY